MTLENLPDSVLKADELKAKYDALNGSSTMWSMHPDFTHEEWQKTVYDGDHLMGYWVWVEYSIEQREGE
jgi:hypothetical protein